MSHSDRFAYSGHKYGLIAYQAYNVVNYECYITYIIYIKGCVMKTVTSTELQKNTREVIDWTRTRGEAVVIETYGKPMAALLSYDDFQAYVQYKQARAARFAQLRKAAAANAATNELNEAEAEVLVDMERQALATEQA